jgi:hypothetical protein
MPTDDRTTAREDLERIRPVPRPDLREPVPA